MAITSVRSIKPQSVRPRQSSESSPSDLEKRVKTLLENKGIVPFTISNPAYSNKVIIALKINDNNTKLTLQTALGDQWKVVPESENTNNNYRTYTITPLSKTDHKAPTHTSGLMCSPTPPLESSDPNKKHTYINNKEKLLQLLSCPDISSVAKLTELTQKLQHVNMSLHDWGSTSSGYSWDVALKASQSINDSLHQLEYRLKVLSDGSEKEKALDVIRYLMVELNDFETGNVYRQLTYDPINEKGLTSHDERTLYQKFGVESIYIREFINHVVMEHDLIEYKNAGLLQASWYPFIQEDVSIDTVQTFLGLFTPQEKMDFYYIISREDVAEALSAGVEPEVIKRVITMKLVNGNFLNRAKLSQYYPELLEKNDTEYKYNHPNVYLLLFFGKANNSPALHLNEETFPETTEYQAKIDALDQYKSLGLSAEDILVALKIPDLSLDHLKNTLKKYNGFFTGKDVFDATINHINLDEAQKLYRLFPQEKNGFKQSFIANLIALQKYLPKEMSMQAVIPYIKLLSSNEDSSWGYSIGECLQHHYTIEDMKKYKDLGIEKLSNILQAIQVGLSVEWLKDLQQNGIQLKDYSKNYSIYDLIAWKSLSGQQVKILFDFMQMNRFPESITAEMLHLSPEKVLLYLTNPGQRTQLVNFLNQGISVNDAIKTIENQTSLPDVAFATKYKFELNNIDISTIRAHHLEEFIPLFPDNADNITNDDIFSLIALLGHKTSLSQDLIKQAIQGGMNLEVALKIVNEHENLADYLPYSAYLKNSWNIFNVSVLHLFGITAEKLSELIPEPENIYKANIDQIILAQKDTLPQKARECLEHYNLSFPSRYPVSILKTMMNPDESPEAKRKPTVLIIASKSDWNGAFQQNQSVYNELITKGYTVYIYEVARDREAIHVLENFHRTTGRQIDFLLINGHGESGDIELSSQGTWDERQIDLSDRNKFGILHEGIFAPHAHIGFKSCSTGKGGTTGNNIAGMFADLSRGTIPKSEMAQLFREHSEVNWKQFFKDPDAEQLVLTGEAENILNTLNNIALQTELATKFQETHLVVSAPNRPTSLKHFLFDQHNRVVGMQYVDDPNTEERIRR